ncbi:MAG: uncharacterized protein KVP18_005034 [Porospora cf. gigantea A]|uniref:uncharacterized protein n=1 Tax=Porospora cf. gigantea A TaxID=2853593 RepID=UPI00355A3AE8|nr:MAG: hypothetical protein KVP18_005034 [Porospora cf. gigantea A]
MHFYGWKLGLKTGVYYLRTQAAVDAIKFTVDVKTAQTAKKATKTDENACVWRPKNLAEDEICAACSG